MTLTTAAYGTMQTDAETAWSALEGYEVLPYSFKYAWFNYMLLASVSYTHLKMTDKLFRAIMRNLHAYVLLINRDFTVVSYTHLDVYKRQVPFLPVSCMV